jgi:hypothetical protein
MQRREFITLFGGAVATWPLAARAQQPAGRVYRVGYLAIPFREQTLYGIKAFEEGLRSLGYRVGENVVIEYRFANTEMERLPALAADLVPQSSHDAVGKRVNCTAEPGSAFAEVDRAPTKSILSTRLSGSKVMRCPASQLARSLPWGNDRQRPPVCCD